MDQLFFLVEFLGVVVGAVAGALATMRDTRYKYDAIGVVGLAFITALGGGIARDVILQKGPPLAFMDLRYMLTAFAGAFIGLLFGNHIGRNTERAILLVDAAALGLFAVAGCTRALNAGMLQLAALLLGVVTAVGGGMLRDVLTGRAPRVFEHGQFYAIAAVFGSIVFLVSDRLGMSREFSTFVGSACGFCLRVASLKFNWRTRHVGLG